MAVADMVCAGQADPPKEFGLESTGGPLSALQGDSILVTGATGSFGKVFLDRALRTLDPARLVVFSRDELKQHELRGHIGEDERLCWFIGDVRDSRWLERAMYGITHVVHAADA